jgi:hypothetical protein
MQKGHILGYDFGRVRHELLKAEESNDCPPGSTCAQAAVERVRRLMNEPRRVGITLSKARFVEKTGYGE